MVYWDSGWPQPFLKSFQFDVLPITLSGPNEMQPGDLVFVSAIYNNEKGIYAHIKIPYTCIWRFLQTKFAWEKYVWLNFCNAHTYIAKLRSRYTNR